MMMMAPPESTDAEIAIRKGIEWIDFIMSVSLFAFFYYQKTVKKRCKFEVLYVTGVGGISDFIKVTAATVVPARLTIQENGIKFGWSRYFGWLTTCPVLLIHLSNLAGKEVFDVRRMMKILVAYQLLMCSGATAGMTDKDNIKWGFYLFAVFWLFVVFRYGKSIFAEAKMAMPKRAAPVLYRIMGIFYGGWAAFGITWFMGPEGVGWISPDAAKAVYAVLDILTKNVYAMHGWYLRWYILRKHNKPEEFVEQENVAEENQPKELKILLVEQDEVFGYFFYNMLVQHGSKVDLAKNLSELMAKTSNVGIQYDMIMINHDLAKQNNYQIMFEIRKSLFMLPVISYGRNIPKDEMDNRTATGIDDFLVAPFPDDEVRNKMTKWSRRASVDPSLIMNMSNMAAMANSATAIPGKGAAPTMSFGTGVRHSDAGPGVNKGGFKMGAIGEEATDCDNWVEPRQGARHPPANDGSADLNSKLDLLMRQLEDVKSSTSAQTREMQQKMDQQQKAFEQQQQQMMMSQQMMQQPQQMMQQQPQQMMMPQPMAQAQEWEVQPQQAAGQPRPNPSAYQVEGGFDYI